MEKKIAILAAAVMCAAGTLSYAGQNNSDNKAPLSAQKVIDEQQQGQATSCVIMSEDMEGSPQTHELKAFVSLINRESKNAVDANPFVNGRKLCLSGLDFGTSYSLNIKKGLKSTDGSATDKDISIDFKTIDSNPYISFGSGNILTAASNEKNISIESVNVNSFKISLFRISTASLNTMNMYNLLSDNLERYRFIDLTENYGEFISSKIISVQSIKNHKSTTVVNLLDLKDNLNDGMYALLVTKDDGDTSKATAMSLMSDNSQDFYLPKFIMLTDIGLTTYRGDNGIDAAVRSLSQAKPIAQASVKLISNANEVLAKGMTDENGYIHFDEKLCSGQDAMSPRIIQVSKDQDVFSYDLRKEPLYIDSDKYKGPYYDLNSSYRVYAYTNRSLFRPGEKVYFNAIVRNTDFSASDLKALKLTVTSPTGVTFDEVTLNSPKAGAFEYEMTLPKEQASGRWDFTLGFDKNNVIASNFINVANFKPTSIEVSLSDKKILNPQDEITLKADYFYGAAGRNLSVDGDFLINPDNHPVQMYPDYYFGAKRDVDSSCNEYSEFNGIFTDENGTAAIRTSVSDKDYPQKLIASVNLTDPANTTVSTSEEYKIAYDKPMIGIKKTDDGSGHLSFSVIEAMQDGTTLAGDASYAVYKSNFSYQYALVNNRWQYIQNEYLVPVTSGNVVISKDRDSKFSLDLEDGWYVIELGNENTSTVYNFTVGSCSYDLDNSPDRFSLTTDKEIYEKGDEVLLSFDSPYSGYADLVLGIKGADEISHHEIVLGHNEIRVKLSDAVSTGTYALLTTYSDLSNQVKTSARSMGLAYIKLDDSALKLSVTSDLPKNVKPNSSLDITLDIPQADDNTYVSAALVDNGILSIDEFKEPKPEDLLSKTPFKTDVFDVYSYLISHSDSNGQGYGDEMSAKIGASNLSTVNKKLFSSFVSAQKVENGKARIHFEIPDVSTSAKLMVQTWSSDRLGSYSKDVLVRDKAVSKLSAPYYMHYGDEIDGVFSLTNLTKEDVSYSYSVECSGALSCSIKGEKTISSNAEDTQTLNIKTKMSDDPYGFIKISVQGSDGYVYESTKDIEVLQSSSTINEKAIAVLEPNAKKDITPRHSFKAGASANVTFGDLPFGNVKDMGLALTHSQSFSVYEYIFDAQALIYTLKSIDDENSDDYKNVIKALSDRLAYLQSIVSAQGGIYSVYLDYDETAYATANLAKVLFMADEAGLDVKKSILLSMIDYLKEHISDNDECTAAMSMYVLASSGINVQSNLTYMFDHNDIKSVSALTVFAQTFALYGDSRRQREAIDKAQQSLNTLEGYYAKFSKAKTDKEYRALYSKIREYDPHYVNTIDSDVLMLIKASLGSNEGLNLENLYEKLSKNIITPASSDYVCRSMLIELSALYGQQSSDSVVPLKFSEGKLSIENPFNERKIAIVNIEGYTEGILDKDNSLVYTEQYFTADGMELRAPYNVNLNEDIFVVYTIKSSVPLRGELYVQTPAASNTIYIRDLNDEDANRYPFAAKLTPDYNKETYAGDYDTVRKFNLYNSYEVKFAAMLKAAYKGKSEALMSTVTSTNAVGSTSKFIIPSHTISIN